MFYTLYLGLEIGFLEIKQLLIEIFRFKQIEGMDIYKDTDKELSISCNWFSMKLNMRSRSITFLGEDYNMDLKCQIWFELLSSVEGASEMMMYVIGRILEQTQGDAILLSNGDTPILERRNGFVTVDDTKLGGQKRFPFDKLEIEYDEGELKQM